MLVIYLEGICFRILVDIIVVYDFDEMLEDVWVMFVECFLSFGRLDGECDRIVFFGF